MKQRHERSQLITTATTHVKKQNWLQKLLEKREDCGKMKKGKNCNG